VLTGMRVDACKHHSLPACLKLGESLHTEANAALHAILIDCSWHLGERHVSRCKTHTKPTSHEGHHRILTTDGSQEVSVTGVLKPFGDETLLVDGARDQGTGPVGKAGLCSKPDGRHLHRLSLRWPHRTELLYRLKGVYAGQVWSPLPTSGHISYQDGRHS